MQGTLVKKTDIHVLRARGKRTTTWTWKCSCSACGRFFGTKDAAVQAALGHGASTHQRNARVIAPASDAPLQRQRRR